MRIPLFHEPLPHIITRRSYARKILQWPEKVAIVWAVTVLFLVGMAIQASPTPDISVHAWFATRLGLEFLSLVIAVPWVLLRSAQWIAGNFIRAIIGLGREPH